MIKAKIIADSIHRNTGTRITTFELEFPRWILSEFNTHRLLSRNSASSRAIPIKANIENIMNNTAIPVHWGLNQAGMVADNVADEETQKLAIAAWIRARDAAIQCAEQLIELGIHKQVANRLIENFTYQKVVTTAVDWDNFFWLRHHKDAQPEIKELAQLMFDVYQSSIPTELEVGEWHTPYFKDGYWSSHMEESLEHALMVSSSCCAQVSYRKQDDSIEKAEKVFGMLNLFDDTDETRKHASPVEHQASPMPQIGALKDIKGATHQDINGQMWSGNFRNWIQYRHLIPNESCKWHPDITHYETKVY